MPQDKKRRRVMENGENSSLSKDVVKYDSILSLLPKEAGRLSKSTASQGFENDQELFDALKALISGMQCVRELRSSKHRRLAGIYASSIADDFATLDSPMVGRAESAVASVQKWVEEHRALILARMRVGSSEKRTRFARFCELCEMEDADILVLAVLFVLTVSRDIMNTSLFGDAGYESESEGGVTYAEVASLLDIPFATLMKTLSDSRRYVKDGLVPTCSSIGHVVRPLSRELVSCFLSVTISGEQYLGVEKTLLGALLRAEPNFADTPAGQAVVSDLKSHDEKDDADVFEDNSMGDDAADSKFPLAAFMAREREKETRFKKNKDDLDSGSDAGPSQKKPKHRAKGSAKGDFKKSKDGEKQTNTGPYVSDLEYLQDQFRHVQIMFRLATVNQRLEHSGGDNDHGSDCADSDSFTPYRNRGGRNGRKNPETMKRVLQRKLVVLENNITRRLAATRAAARSEGTDPAETPGRRKRSKKAQVRDEADAKDPQGEKNIGWIPRLERLASAVSLVPFEKHLLVAVIAAVMIPKTLQEFSSRVYDVGDGSVPVAGLLEVFSHSFEEQISNRRYFYKSATLVKNGVVQIEGAGLTDDLTSCRVRIDRRMLDFVVGLDTEFSEIVDGSHLYSPEVKLEDVVLPDTQKQIIFDTVRNFDAFQTAQKNVGMLDSLTYGRGMAMLFFGPSGTGKTMMANAIAAIMKKKMLLINFPSLGVNEAGKMIKLIFREAKIHDAVLFFDECESIFKSREKDSCHSVNMLLTELERHDGLSILATNRPHDLDEAMHRRVTLAIEFSKPDHLLREKIWKALLPPKLKLDDDVDFAELALKFELTGGFIKNAMLTAISSAVARGGKDPVVCMEDLRKGASHQLRGRLSSVDFDRRIVPTRGLDDVIVEDSNKKHLQEIVNYSKATSILFGQWGFQQQHGTYKGLAVLFYGAPGTGKTMAAEAIGFDVGRPLKVVNCAELLSKWVGESQKNIDAVFQEARAMNAVLVFDECEGLFGHRSADADSSRHDNVNVGILLHHISTFPGIVVLITNLREGLDQAFFRRFKFIVEFKIPKAKLRKQLWKLLLPAEAPKSSDIDFDRLANVFELAGGNIKNVVFRAATRACLRKEEKERKITMADLESAAQEEVEKQNPRADIVKHLYL